jgi:hypothetical protein
MGRGAHDAEPLTGADVAAARDGDGSELEVRGDQPAAAHADHPAVPGDPAGEAHPPRARGAHGRARPSAQVDPAVLPGGVAVGADGEGARDLPAQRPGPGGVRDVGGRQDEEDGEEGEAEQGSIVAGRRSGGVALSQSRDTRASCPA